MTAPDRRWSDLLWLAALGLLVQAFWLWRLPHPAYMDAYYYTVNGARLAGGHGLTEPFIWQFLDDPAGLPALSHSYWMPLASLLAAAGYALGGGFRAAQLPFWLLAGLLPLLAYTISRQISRARWTAVAAALFTMAGGFYAPAWNQPETFAPFAWIGGGCLLLLGRRQNGRANWLAIGLLAGLAHLARADGLLLLGVAALWGLGIGERGKGKGDWGLRNGASDSIRYPVSNLLFLLGGYLLVMGPWLARNWLVFGRPLSAAGTQTLFLTTYDDLFAYGRSFSLASYLDWGWGNILRSKLIGVWLAVQSFVAVSGLIFLTPFLLLGWWANRRRPLLRPFTLYTLLLFATMSLIFTFPGGRGGLFHASVAIWPWTMALAADGLGRAVDWVAARLRHWQPARAKRLFAGLFVGLAFVVSGAVGLSQGPQEDAAALEQIGAMLPETAVVMAGNAPALSYHTGLTAVSVPNEPPSVLLQAADRYGVTHLVLDGNRPRPLAELYNGRERPPRIALLAQFGSSRLYVIRGE